MHDAKQHVNMYRRAWHFLNDYCNDHDDVMTRTTFPYYSAFVRLLLSLVEYQHKGPVMPSFDIPFLSNPNKLLNK